MRWNRTARAGLTAAIGGVLTLASMGPSPAAAGPAHAGSIDARVPGPCALARSEGEAIQDLSIRLIECAATRWPVEGGAEKAICIARRESGLIPTATSATGQYVGLFQHSAAAWPDRYAEWTRPAWGLKQSPLNGRTNAIVTIRMVSSDGWGPWSGLGC